MPDQAGASGRNILEPVLLLLPSFSILGLCLGPRTLSWTSFVFVSASEKGLVQYSKGRGFPEAF